MTPVQAGKLLCSSVGLECNELNMGLKVCPAPQKDASMN